MSASKLIVVFGATGSQGGSVARTFLDDPNWRVRGVTRNPASPKATALRSRGAELVQADMDEPASLAAALKGADAVFAVSDFWAIIGSLLADPASQSKLKPGQAANEWAKEREAQQLKNVIDAAAQVPTLERFIISSMPNVTKLSGGKYTQVAHFDAKAIAEDYARETYPDLWAKTSVHKPGFFLSNFVSDPAGKPIKQEDGSFHISSFLDPDLKIPWIAQEEDTGHFVKAYVTEPAGKNVIAYREWITPRELAQAFSEVTGLKVVPVQSPLGQFWFPCPPELQREFAENLAWANEFGYEGRNDPSLIHPKDLNSLPKLGTVVDYLKKQDLSQIFV